MKKYLRLFLIIFLMMIFINNVKAEDYKTGDLIKYKDIKFYVMEDKGDYLTLLKATPLTVDEVNNYGKGYVNRNIDSSTCKNEVACDYNGTGYGGVAYYSSDNCVYRTTDECKINYNDSDIKHIVDGWSNQVLNQNDLKEVAITYTKDDSDQESITENYKVRLITKDEVSKMSKIPTWLSRYSYWTMSPKDSSSVYYIKNGQINNSFVAYFVYSVIGNHEFTYFSDSPIGVRPVININKSASITKIKNNLKDINDTEFKIGDMVEYNGKEFYVLKDASKTDDKLTMVTKLPLSYEEVNKIDIGNNTLIHGTIGLEDSTEYHPGYVRYYYNSDNCYERWESYKNDCDTNYDKSIVKPIVDEWAEKFFEDKLAKDELGYKARLLTVDDLKDKLGYVGRGGSNGGTQTESYQMSEDTPFTLTNCWTMTSVLDETSRVYTIENNGNVFRSDVYDTKGICSVVTIEKQIAINDKINNEDNDSNKNFIEKIFVPNTLLKNPVFIVVIGIILIVVSTIVISVILKKRHK